MYSLLHGILSDKKDGSIFTCFSVWHFVYISAAVLTAMFLLYRSKNKDLTARIKTEKRLIGVAFAIMIADFFFMPLAYGEIDIEKLPFHVCTAMCVMCFASYHNEFLRKYRASFALLGFISNLVYLIYPAGVMWHQVSPLSYRVIETLTFHAVMSVYGLLVLIRENENISRRKCLRDLAVLAGMTLWALLGNWMYNGNSEGYSHFFNWFFVVQDPFGVFHETLAPYIMPLLNIAVFFAAEIIISFLIKALCEPKTENK